MWNSGVTETPLFYVGNTDLNVANYKKTDRYVCHQSYTCQVQQKWTPGKITQLNLTQPIITSRDMSHFNPNRKQPKINRPFRNLHFPVRNQSTWQCQYTLHCLIHYDHAIGVVKIIDISGPGNGEETLVRMTVFRMEQKNLGGLLSFCETVSRATSQFAVTTIHGPIGLNKERK